MDGLNLFLACLLDGWREGGGSMVRLLLEWLAG
uniref:Uncharacterized protein n=1 Tax=Picea glauca TaxID=3330 RepID=A0A101M0Y8_PICGL|nr:hypothetical protein ABT39_MTgene4234 [Picea glauca]